MTAKILLLDVETAPNKAYVWGLYDQNINIDWIESSGYVLCYAAKWLGEKKVVFDSVQKSKPEDMLKGIHRLMDEADAVITYNGVKFDEPTLMKEFVLYSLGPPSPYRSIDLYRTVRKVFRFPSNKLDYVCQALGLGGKIRHDGPELWLKCMTGDKKAWRKMQRYNKKDVTILEALYERIKPWVVNHPNLGVYVDSEEPVCPTCGSNKMQRRGFAYTAVQKYQRFQCQNCSAWSRGSQKMSTPTKQKSIRRV